MKMHNSLGLHGVGLGTFPFSNVFGKVTADEAEAITRRYLNEGSGYIQTAPYYAEVEPLLGRILSSVPRDSYRLATLCVKDKDSQRTGKRHAVLAQCEESLKRLSTDYIDLLMTATTKADDAPFSETIAAMQELKAQGRARAIGVCNVTLAQLQEYNAGGAVEYVQNRMSLIDQEADRDVRSYCVDNGIGLIPYNVIEWGLLTSKMLETWNLRDGDLRTKVLPVFGDQPKAVLHDWVLASLKPIADRYDATIEAMAIAWVLQQPGVVACPVGATSEAQLQASLKAEKLLGNTELLADLDGAYQTLVDTVRDTTGKSLNEFLRNSYGTW